MTAQIREMDISTAQTLEMDFSEYTTMKRVEIDFSEYTTIKREEMNFSLTTREQVEWVKATDIVLMAELMMMFQMATILCPRLISRRRCPACTGVGSHPSEEEVAPLVSSETVIYT